MRVPAMIGRFRAALAARRSGSDQSGGPVTTTHPEIGVAEVGAPRPFAEPNRDEAEVYTFPVPAPNPPKWVLQVVERRRGVPQG